MGRMIDTDAAYAVLTDYYHHTTGTQHQALKEALGRVETVDAVPVVRCKDCKNVQHDTIFREYWCRGREVDPDGYCSDGEQKDGEQHE